MFVIETTAVEVVRPGDVPLQDAIVMKSRALSCQNRWMAGTPSGFEFDVTQGGVVIRHHGRKAATLRGAAAQQFLADADRSDSQELMARVTGNYKRGNERVAKDHPRNHAI